MTPQHKSNRPFLSCHKPLFQIEAKCKATDMKMIFILMQMKLIFTRKGSALSLVLKVRVFGTWKWPKSYYEEEGDVN